MNATQLRKVLHGDSMARCDGCGQMNDQSVLERVDEDHRLCENCQEIYAETGAIGRYPDVPRNAPRRSVSDNDGTETREAAFDVTPSRNGRDLDGYVAVFNSRTRIPDRGGDFDEELKPGFADRSLREHGTPVMQFDHGRDPRVGTVPIGRWTEWRADGKGYRVRGYLLDNPVVEPVRQALSEGALNGLSFRFKVNKGGDKWERRHGGGPDLRHVHDADVHEAGPVVFPAYKGAKVSIRSLTQLDVPVLRSYDGFGEDALTVVAYATTWRGITEQRSATGDPVRVRHDPHCLDEWLADWHERGRPMVPILREHGRDGHSRPIGYLADAYADDYGLWTRCVFDATGEGLQALEDIFDGTLRGFSEHLKVHDQYDDGGLVHVTRAELVECGPCENPFDRGAVILSAGGVEVETRAGFESLAEVLEFSRIATGVDLDEAVEAIRQEQRDMQRDAELVVRVADSLAREIAARQGIVLTEYRDWTRYHRGEGFNRARDADQDEVELRAELSEVLHGDRALIAQVLRSAGADPYFSSPFRSAKTAISLALSR